MKKVLLTICEYNKITNEKLFGILDKISLEKLNLENGSYFNTVTGILNHIIITCILWMQRIKTFFKNYNSLQNDILNKQINSISQIISHDYSEIVNIIKEIDLIFVSLIKEINEDELNKNFIYMDTKNKENTKEFGLVLFHILNHIVHHRGQISQILDSWEIENDYSNLISAFDRFL
jgi:uncharacterized damage-inducible protein DinB